MSSTSKKTAPYGSWKSPITSDLIVAQSITLSEVRLDGGQVYWLEGRPLEQGRYVVVREVADGPTDVTPPPFNARSRVHEYGGGSWTVRNGTLYFSNLVDGCLYRQVPGAFEPQALTPEPPSRERQWRFADGVIDPNSNRWIGIREDHTVDGEPVNAVVAVDLSDAGAPVRVLASGHDFYASPRLSPDGRRLAWLAWDHPNMPWSGTRLYLGTVAQDGTISEPEPIAGEATESIFQPEWSPDGTQIVFVSDRSGWWNLYSLALTTRVTRALAPMAAEFGLPQWLFGASTYAFAGPERIICSYSQGGLGYLATLDLANETLTPIDIPFTEFGSLHAESDRAVFRAGAPDHPASIVALDLASGRHSVLKRATDVLDRSDLHLADYLTQVVSVEFPTTGGETAFGLFYPPHNPDYVPEAEERPPLLVKCHGGPTSAASSALNLGIQYWTSRAALRCLT